MSKDNHIGKTILIPNQASGITMVILIKSVGNTTVTHPMKVTKLVKESPFRKYTVLLKVPV